MPEFAVARCGSLRRCAAVEVIPASMAVAVTAPRNISSRAANEMFAAIYGLDASIQAEPRLTPRLLYLERGRFHPASDCSAKG